MSRLRASGKRNRYATLITLEAVAVSIQVAVYCGLGQLEARRRPYVGFREHCGGTETASSGAGRSLGTMVCRYKETGASEASGASESALVTTQRVRPSVRKVHTPGKVHTPAKK